MLHRPARRPVVERLLVERLLVERLLVEPLLVERLLVEPLRHLSQVLREPLVPLGLADRQVLRGRVELEEPEEQAELGGLEELVEPEDWAGLERRA